MAREGLELFLESARPLHILIVDDEEPFRKVLTAVLRNKGEYRVDECESGEAALEALRQKAYSVVILDYLMEAISGLNVLQWMLEQKMDTPVIVLTGAGSEHIAVEAMKLGAYDYIRKDQFEQQRLPVIVNGVFERYLFKKEKERLEKMTQENQKDIASLDLLRNAIALSAKHVDGTLANISRDVDLYSDALRPLLNSDGHEPLAKMTEELKKEYHFMSVIAKSLSDLSDLMYSKFKGLQDTQSIEESLRSHVQELTERTQTDQNPARSA